MSIVITGASDGIGAAAARLIRHARPDAELVIIGRNPAKTRAVASEVGASHHCADFSRLDEVRDLAAELNKLERIDVLANNAGGSFDGPTTTEDGYELTWQVNYLAPYLLTNLVRHQLFASHAQVINTSSMASWLSAREGKFTQFGAYGVSKRANVWFTRSLHSHFHRPEDGGISAVAFHPGVIATNFASDSNSFVHWGYHTSVARLFSPPEEGGRVLARFILGTPGVHWESGRYYNDRLRPGFQRPTSPMDVEKLFSDTARSLGVQW